MEPRKRVANLATGRRPRHGRDRLALRRRPAIAPLLAALTILAAGLDGRNAAVADTIGETEAVVRTVTGTQVNADQRRLAAADPVFHDELIETAADSASKLRFQDETSLTVGPNSKVTLDDFVYDTTTGEASMVINTSRGIARFVSGKMRKNAYSIRTPTATLGIRGTAFTVIVADDGTTDVIVESGEVVVQGVQGPPQVVPAGLATQAPRNAPARRPAPPPVEKEAEMAEMDAILLVSAGAPKATAPEQAGELRQIKEEAQTIRKSGCSC